MDDLTRFALAWAGLLAIVAIVQAVRAWRGEAPASLPDAKTVQLRLEVIASLRWWAFPLLYVAEFAGAFGAHAIDDALLDLVVDHGWKIVTRNPDVLT